MYSIKFGINLLKRNPAFHVFMVVILAVLVMAAILLQSMSDQLQTQAQVTKQRDSVFIYISSALAQNEIHALIQSIRSVAEKSRSPIKDLKFIPKNEVLETLKKSSPELGDELSTLGEASQDLIPQAVIVSGDLNLEAREEIRKLDGVQQIEMQVKTLSPMIQAMHAGQLLLGTVGVSVGFVALVVLLLLGKMLAKEHQSHMQLIRQIGGNPRDQILPFFFSQMLFVVSSGIVVVALGYAFHENLAFLFSYMIPKAWSISALTSLQVLLTGVALWMAIGALGAFVQAKALRDHRI